LIFSDRKDKFGSLNEAFTNHFIIHFLLITYPFCAKQYKYPKLQKR
jgi:hypothetical protein